MVRLCVPAGEDQHALTRNSRLSFSAAEPSLIDSPLRACILATVVTAGASIVGLARPGTFLRNAAFFGTIEGVCTACDIYGRQELNRAVFKLDGLEDPKPFKLWERSKQWTPEDVSLFGAATGLLVASNPRLLPGATGISRFFGVAVVGWAIGAKTAEFGLGTSKPYVIDRLETMRRRAQYQRLSQNDRAKQSLSLLGKTLLLSYTADSPFLRILNKPSGRLTGVANPDSDPVGDHGPNDAHTEQPVLMMAAFEKEELAAPDYDHGHRQYCMDAADTDLEALEEHLEHLNRLRVEDAKELAFLWQELAPKEHKMHQLPQEDPEKDLIRRELQLLNSIATHTSVRLGVIRYAQADARKRLAQVKNEDPAAISKLPLPGTDELLLDTDFTKTHVPQRTVSRIRKRWEDLRADAANIEQVLAEIDELNAQGLVTSHVIEKAEAVRKTHKHARQNLVATERLLKEFEDRIYKADAEASR